MSAEPLLVGWNVLVALIIFDFGGTPLDSEYLVSRAVTRQSNNIEWSITPNEVQNLVVGRSLPDMVSANNYYLAYPASESWPDRLTRRFMQVMENEIGTTDGAIGAFLDITAFGPPWCIASNSTHAGMRENFAGIGSSNLGASHRLSSDYVPCGKPTACLFFAADTAVEVSPSACIVIEDHVARDTVTRADGTDCLAFSPNTDCEALSEVGAKWFKSTFKSSRMIAQIWSAV